MTDTLPVAGSGVQSSAPRAPSRRRRPAIGLTGGLRSAWLAGVALFGAQFVGLLAWSWHLWARFDLGADMAAYSQAWQQIATGHLDPYLTTFAYNYPHYGYPFYQSHFELLLWPLAVLYWLWPHAIDLLVVQDAALAGAGLVVYRWGLDHLARHWPLRRGAVFPGAVLLAVLLLTPWTYWVASFDFHLETVAIFFVALAGRDLWSGRPRGWLWVAGALLCGDVAATYVLGLGVAALLSGRTGWKRGIGLLAAGSVWLGIVGLAASGKGSSLSAGYGYLANHPVGAGISGIVSILVGVLSHPNVPAHVLGQHRADIYKYLAGAGTLGIVSPVGAAMFVCVLVPDALNHSAIFISAIGSTQALAAVLAVAVGTVFVMTWLASRGRSRLGPVLAAVVGVVAVVQTAVVSAHWTPIAGHTFATVGPATAAELSAVGSHLPERAEAIVSQQVMGRFATRHLVYPYLDLGAGSQQVPVFGKTVYVVLVPSPGVNGTVDRGTEAAIAMMRHLGAPSLAHRDGVAAFAWHVPPGQHHLTFPPG